MPRYPLDPPPWLLGMKAALALRAFKISASWGYVDSPWKICRDGVGKLSMSASGDWLELDVILTGRAWLAPVVW
jgi:hypothetical protein